MIHVPYNFYMDWNGIKDYVMVSCRRLLILFPISMENRLPNEPFVDQTFLSMDNARAFSISRLDEKERLTSMRASTHLKFCH